jgi:diguanylate cyclase (GGDEF)-like protein/PAS domain S-box-containing protein
MNAVPLRAVLLIEDNAGDARLMREMFREHGARGDVLTRVSSMTEAETYLASSHVDVILLDLGLADAQRLAAVRRTHAAAPRTPLVVLTGLDDESLAAQALQEGAEDYLIKGQIETRGLMRSLRYAIERKSMAEALGVEKERAIVTLNCIGDAVASTDTHGNVTFLNVAAEALSDWPVGDAVGRPLSEIFNILDCGNRRQPLHENGLDTIGLGTVRFPATCILIRRDDTEIPVDGTIAPIFDRHGHAVGTVVALRDVTENREMTREIVYAAQHDFLTGLPNRLLLHERISAAIADAARANLQVAVLFLDLDGFKHINDSLGHAIGDKLLQSVAKRLAFCVRGSDIVSRQGGDEFIILIPDMKQPADAKLMARRLMDAVSQVHYVDAHELQISVSIGVSIYPEDALDTENMIKNADTAMYQAKENGRRNCQFFESPMRVRAVARQTIEEGLRRGLERHEFILYYQPKINLRSGRIVGAEALIRWAHPTNGLVSPADFIPIAEASGLILPIGAWVLREACRQVVAWKHAGLPHTKIAVNVSALEFRAERFLDGVFNILAETGLDPASLELELTESVLMQHVENVAPVLKRLRYHGIRVSIDDFGTGYSSLSYLHRFPVDGLKIDQSFVREIGPSGEVSHIVSAVLGMARNLNLRVVAEGVENQAELAFLREHDCDEAQGYLFSPPVPAEAFARLLEAEQVKEELLF